MAEEECPVEIKNSEINESDDDDESEDGDYVPSEHEVSEEENSGDDEDFPSGDLTSGKRARTKGKKPKQPTDSNPRLARNRQQAPDEGSIELRKRIEEEQAASKEQKEKTKADALWANFMSDVGPTKNQKQSTSNTNKTNSPSNKVVVNGKAVVKKPVGTVKVTQVFDFAGETVRLEKEVRADSKEAKDKTAAPNNDNMPFETATPGSANGGGKRPGGLGAVLGFINKKQKISTLDKSKLDWEKYKNEAGITDELKNHTNSKTSYLERKEFLERTDQRQFEKERDARLASSSKR